jgi:hypothetical protein
MSLEAPEISSLLVQGVPTPASMHEDGGDATQSKEQDINHSQQQRVLTPPTSDDAGKRDEVEDQEDEDIGVVEPSEYYDGGKIPIFRPVRLVISDPKLELKFLFRPCDSSKTFRSLLTRSTSTE